MLQRDLVRSSAVRQPAMVALLDRLEGLALVARKPAASDRRAVTVQLTAEGQDAARIGGQALIDANNAGVEHFSAEEVATLVSLLQRFIEPVEIARLAAYLASPLSSATNGAALRADGGVLTTVL